MGNICVTIASVRAYSSNDTIRYRLVFKEQIEAIVRNDNGDYVQSKVDYIDFVPSVLMAQCITHIDGLAYLYGKRKEQSLRDGNHTGFTAADLTIIVNGATFELERTKFIAGEEYADVNGVVVGTHDHDGYNTNIVGITLTEASQARMTRVLDKALGL